MPLDTISVRVPQSTKTWLERFSLSRGSLSSAASRLIEEARRREVFRFVDFQDSPFGRIAYAQGSRVPVYLAWLTAKDYKFDAEKLAQHFNWTLAKAETVLAYAAKHEEEIIKEASFHDELDDFDALSNILPNLQNRAV